MDKYFGFFLCGYGWKSTEASAELIREAIDIVQPNESLTITGRMPDEVNTLKGSISGDYSEYAGSLAQLSNATYIIANKNFPKLGTEIHICFEGLSGAYEYALKSHSQSENSVVAFRPQPDGLVTLSISVRHDIWKRLQNLGIANRLVKAVETAFVSLGATYGYGHPVPLPLSGRFSLIWGNSKQSYPRIVDFNYREYIERICELNFISSEQLKGRNFDERIRSIEGVEVKGLLGSDGISVEGLAVYLRHDRNAADSLRSVLGELVWLPRERGSSSS